MQTRMLFLIESNKQEKSQVSDVNLMQGGKLCAIYRNETGLIMKVTKFTQQKHWIIVIRPVL